MVNLSIIKDLCQKKGISVRKLAENINVKPSSLQSAIDNNSTTLANLEKIANYFGVSVGLFFGEDSLPKEVVELKDMLEGWFDMFDKTFCFAINKLANSEINLFQYDGKTFSDKYQYLSYLDDNKLIGYELDVPNTSSLYGEKSLHGDWVYTIMDALENTGFGKKNVLILRKNGIISKNLGILLTLWAQSNYNLKTMLKKYEQYLLVKELDNID